MNRNTLLQAADHSMNSLLSWGIGGIILAVFVAPTFWIMVQAAKKREEERNARDDRESRERSDREMRLVEALARSVEQQKAALDQWLRFEADEKAAHLNLVDRFESIGQTMQKMVERLDASAERDREILQQIKDQRKTA